MKKRAVTRRLNKQGADRTVDEGDKVAKLQAALVRDTKFVTR